MNLHHLLSGENYIASFPLNVGVGKQKYYFSCSRQAVDVCLRSVFQ